MDNVAALPGVDLDEVAEKVVDLELVTSKSYPPQTMLDRASKADLETVLVIGYETDGTFRFWSSIASGPEVLWILELAKLKLINITDHTTGEIPEPFVG